MFRTVYQILCIKCLESLPSCVTIYINREKCSVVLQDGTGDSVAIGGFGKSTTELSKLKNGLYIFENLQLKEAYVNFVGG